jgi:arsenate reductase
VQLLEEEGLNFDRVNYFLDPLDEITLREILSKAGLSPRDVIRTRDRVYSELNLDSDDLSDDVLLAALVEYPSLLQRPIIVRGDRAVLGRPIENVRALF